MGELDNLEFLLRIDTLMRIVGRIGSIFLIVSLYRLWITMASPILRNRSTVFVKYFGIALLISVMLAFIDYIFITSWIRFVSVSFAVIVNWVLAFYLHFQTKRIRQTKSSLEYQEYSKALDAYITSLKNST